MGRAAGVVGLLLVLGLGACSGSGDEQTSQGASTGPGVRQAPEPSLVVLESAKAQPLQGILTEAVALYSSIPEASGAVRGVTAAVVTDKWSWSGAAGTDARGTKLTSTTMLAAGSITKTFVAAEAMRLVRAGKVELDAPLAKYVTHRLTTNGATVREHLSMRSGVADFSPEDLRRMDSAVAAAPGRHWTIAQSLALHSAMVGPPQPGFDYSNTNFHLLGLMIEKVTGRSLGAVLRDELMRPAGLQRIAFQDEEKPVPPIAEEAQYPCGPTADGFVPCRAFASSSVPSGNLAADAPTLARWGYLLYGGRLLPAESVRELTAGFDEYGLGTMRFTRLLGSNDSYGHRGSIPGYTSIVAMVPEQNLSVAVMIADEKNADSFARKLIEAAQPLLGR